MAARGQVADAVLRPSRQPKVAVVSPISVIVIKNLQFAVIQRTGAAYSGSTAASRVISVRVRSRLPSLNHWLPSSGFQLFIPRGDYAMRKISLPIALAGLIAAGTAAAATSPATGSFNVTADVQGSCKVTATTDIAFGTYDPADVNFATPLDQSGSVSVRCVKGMTPTVTLDQGLNPSGTCAAPARAMLDSATSELLSYDIYSDAGHSSAWGCDVSNDVSFTAAASNTATTLTTYGRIPAGQNVGLGTFSDTVTVEVAF